MAEFIFDPGQMTARLELEAPEPVPDGQGGATLNYRLVAAMWARIEPIIWRVKEIAAAETFTPTHRIWIGHRDGVEKGMRFRKGACLFTVRVVQDPDETRRYTLCHCEEDGR